MAPVYKKFVRIAGPGPVGVVPNQGQGHWASMPDTPFDFDLANPNLFPNYNPQSLYVLSGKQAAFRAGLKNMATGRGENFQGSFKGQRTESQHYHLRANDFDQSMVWFQNMEDPNDAFRGPTANGPALNEFTLASDSNPRRVSLSSSSSNNHGNVHARRLTNANPGSGGLKSEANANNTDDLCTWGATPNSANVNHAFAQTGQTINARGSQRWPAVPVPSNGYMQAYGFQQGLADGLPVFPNNQAFSPSFELGPAMGAVPNLDSSSSSSCRVNGSSPNTVFGSFSSSIGPQDMMDMDAREECFHSPSVFPSEGPSYHNPGAIPQAFLSRFPAHDLPVHTRPVFPEVETVSPKMLHINTGPSLPSSSSSESLPNPFRMDSDTEVPSMFVSQQDILPSSAWQARRDSNSKVNTAGRKQLPDKAPHSKASAGSGSGPKRRHGSDATGDKTAAPSSKKPKAKAKGTSQSHHHHRHQSTSGPDHRAKTGTHGKVASSSKATTSVSGAGSSSTAEASTATPPPRSERDEYLVQSKLAGMTYKEIRKQGGFTEAESTLRGRFRTLTKPKEARVRKPEFQEIDDKLLKRAVVKFTKDVDKITRDNVPWKLVAEYMSDHGGSYLFGYTTVRKRWEYLMVTSEDQVKQDRLDQKSTL